MAKDTIKAGTTSFIDHVFVANNNATNQAGLTGLTSASSGLKWYYIRRGGTATSVTPASATVGTFTSGGFKEIDSTNMPGWYEIGVPNAVLAAGATAAAMMLSGVSGMAPVNVQYSLTGVDFQNTNNAGLAALPTNTAGTSGGLPLVGSQIPGSAAGAPGGLGTLDSFGFMKANVWSVLDNDPDGLDRFNRLGVLQAGDAHDGFVIVGGYDTGKDPATMVLLNPTNKASFDASGRVDVGKWLGNAATVDANNLPNVNAKDFGGTAVTALPFSGTSITLASAVTADGKTLITSGTAAAQLSTLAGAVLLQNGTAAGQLVIAAGLVGLSGTQAFNNTGTWTGNIAGSLSGSVGSVAGDVGGNVNGHVGSVAGSIGGSMTGSVGGSLMGDVQGNVSGHVGSVSGTVTAGVVLDKAGYGLASDGLDQIPITTSGPATNWRQMLVMVYRRFFRKSTLTSSQLKTYQDDGSTLLTTQSVSDDGTTQTVNDAS